MSARFTGSPLPGWGVAIAASSFFFTFLAAAMADYFFGPLSYFDPAPWQELFLGAGVMLVLGAWDDMRPLKASTKFLVQLGAAGLAIGLGFQIHALPLLGHQISGRLLSISLTLLWILLITHSFNLIDGLDGLSGGLAAGDLGGHGSGAPAMPDRAGDGDGRWRGGGARRLGRKRWGQG